MLDHADTERLLTVEFGGGETSLRFNHWIETMDQLHAAAADRGMDVKFQSTTNGTCLDSKKMDRLADLGVCLTFSIDGPNTVHNRHRPTSTGKGSFAAATESWRYYSALSKSHPKKPGCSIQSVLCDDLDLEQLAIFWDKMGWPVFDTVLELPSRYLGNSDDCGWRIRQQQYLDNLRVWADGQAKVLGVPDFLSDYKGPADLFKMWLNLFSDRKAMPCQAGITTLAVDKAGMLYPCEGFVGVPTWQVGNIYDGLDREKLSEFQGLRNSAADCCGRCTANAACPKVCFAEEPAGDIEKNFKSGCGFAEALSQIAAHSFEKMLSKSLNSECDSDDA